MSYDKVRPRKNAIGQSSLFRQFWKSAENADKFCVFRNIGDAEGIGGGDAVLATKEEHIDYMQKIMPVTLTPDELDLDVTKFFQPRMSLPSPMHHAYQDAQHYAEAEGGIIYRQLINNNIFADGTFMKDGVKGQSKHPGTGVFIVITESFI